MSYWNGKESFSLLCDLVAKNNLIVMTGAGVSTSLKNVRGDFLPNWTTLLNKLNSKFANQLDKKDRIDVKALISPNLKTFKETLSFIKTNLKIKLSEKQKLKLQQLLTERPDASALIEAASIYRRSNQNYIDEEISNNVKPAEKQGFSKLHEALLELRARGILTFNYDSGHENAYFDKFKQKIEPIIPEDEDKIIELMANDVKDFFILKAHGCINKKELDLGELVLTSESYRTLLTKQPLYRSFVQNLLTNFNFLFVGFSLSDPDFDQFLMAQENQFGSPIRNHIVINKGKNNQNDPRCILLKRKYGIHTLHVNNFDDIPKIILDATKIPGPNIAKLINRCISMDIEIRKSAHKELTKLSPIGKKIIKARFFKKISYYKKRKKTKDIDKLSELIYSLGKVTDGDHNLADKLIKIMKERKHPELWAHAIESLRACASRNHINELKEMLQDIRRTPIPKDRNFPDPYNRIPKYLTYLICRLQAIQDSIPEKK